MAGAGNLDAVLFDFDGTLYHLAVDWPVALRLDAGGLLAAELAGVAGGSQVADAAQVMRWVSARHLTAVVSGNSEASVVAGLAKMGFNDMPVVGREFQPQKPSPAPLLAALNGLGATGGLMVGDSIHDVHAAHAAGLICAVVLNDRLEFTPDGADYYLESLAELPQLIKDLT